MASTATSARPLADSRAVRLWLWCLVALVMLMVVIGGATRLTGSGLSITEWRPVTGALPPLSQAEWLTEFEKYRQIPQYQLINKGMSLAEFQFIYAWEWGHRQLGRLIGLVYALGFFWFMARGAFDRRGTLYFFGAGLLLGLQGLVGWIMVASGLEPGMTAVAPVKLMLHLTFACLFLAALVIPLARPKTFAADDASVFGARLLALIILAQIALGALVAGSRAGLTYNTWPLMDGMLIPPASGLFAVQPWVENFVDNPLLVQFNHRLGAYLLLALAAWHALVTWRAGPGGTVALRALLLFGLVLGQGILGIITLLLAVPLWAGLAHQALAVALFALAVFHAAEAGRIAPRRFRI